MTITERRTNVSVDQVKKWSRPFNGLLHGERLSERGPMRNNDVYLYVDLRVPSRAEVMSLTVISTLLGVGIAIGTLAQLIH